MFDFLPCEGTVEAIVVSWTGTTVFLVTLKQSIKYGVSEESVNARWRAINKVSPVSRLGMSAFLPNLSFFPHMSPLA